MSEFVHLHLHSQFSLLDGANQIEALARRAAELDMPALALTDHGNLFGAVQFHDAALRHGIKPIIGCEVYVARGGRTSKNGRSDQSNHLVLLAMNKTGYHNLVKLVSLGYLEGFYYRPRIDLELLEQHSEGLIGLSACLKGIVAWNLLQDRYSAARQEAGKLAEVLGRGHFYLELQDHGIQEQAQVNSQIVDLARELELPLVGTNDCHYLSRGDAFAHEVLLCVQTGKTLQDSNRLTYRSDQFYFKDFQEMDSLFGHVPQVLSNTLEVAEKCTFQFGETVNIFPEFQVPTSENLDTYFEKVVRQGFQERLQYLKQQETQGKLRHPIDAYRERLDREIDMIKQMKFPGYFLIVWDFIRHARENNVPVGPGRGSAAGSLVSYAMEITDVDPLQYDLLFERFLNPERVTPPDIDIDFCMHRRSEVIDYVTQKYGRENVSQIITFGTMAARGALRDVGRALNIPYAEVDKIARLVPQTPDATLEKSLETVKELKKIAKSDPRYEQLVKVARQLEGLARHASTHAAGVVIAPRPLIELIPLYKSSKEEITTQYAMSDLERLGLLKMDFLALTTLTVIEQTLSQIGDQLAVEMDINQIDLNDSEVFRLFSEGRTSGIFQFESAGMRDILRRLQPSRFEDLIALNALYRPGPIQGGMIDDFIKRRHGEVTIEYEVPGLEEILKKTYGVIVYQEQVMQIASQLAGFSLGQADLLRRAMGKKKKKAMQAQKKQFLEGCRKSALPASKAKRIFELMEQFAGYGFNKSHSTAYAMLAYQTAYLKARYPVQFMAALLTSEMSSTDKIVKHLGECKEMSIPVRPPDINESQLPFLASGGEIKFGLAGIRNVGESAIRVILDCRERLKRFSSFYEFCEQVDLRLVNKRVVESLIKAGAFDCLGYHRRSLMEVLDRAIEQGQKAERDRQSGQKGLFAKPNGPINGQGEGIPAGEEWPDRVKWAMERETIGFYVTGHPLENYTEQLRKLSKYTASQLTEQSSSQHICIGGLITDFRRRINKKGNTWATFQLEDLTGTVGALVWADKYQLYASLLRDEMPVLLRGRCEVAPRGDIQIVCSEIRNLDTFDQEALRKASIRISLPSLSADTLAQLQELVNEHPGTCPLEFELLEEKGCRLRVIPHQTLLINPDSSFVDAVEKLFGENSVTLYTDKHSDSSVSPF